MGNILVIGMLVSMLVGAWTITAALVRYLRRLAQPKPQARRPAEPAPTRPAAPRISTTMRLAYRNLQIALLQLDQAPDFRRAANFAAQANQVPVSLRQRQYRRFRAALVAHVTRLQQQQVAAEQILTGLTQLVTALGVSAFEAEYICQEAEQGVQLQRPVPPAFQQQIQQAQAEHQDRMQVLEGLSDLDEEAREQLVEQERMLYQERLRSLAGHTQHGS